MIRKSLAQPVSNQATLTHQMILAIATKMRSTTGVSTGTIS